MNDEEITRKAVLSRYPDLAEWWIRKYAGSCIPEIIRLAREDEKEECAMDREREAEKADADNNPELADWLRQQAKAIRGRGR